MKMIARMITTAAIAIFLMPAILPRTGEAQAVMAASGGPNNGTPKAEVFVGYSYLRAVPAPSDGNRLVWLNGGSTSIAFNFNRHLGLVGDFGGFDNSQYFLTGANPSSTVNSSGSVYTYLFGPRLSFRNHSRITPFAQVLFGGIHASQVTLSSGCMGAGCTPLPAENSFAMTGGGGLDIKVRRHLAIRIIQAEYMMTQFENHATGSGASQNDMRLSSGIVFRFGGNAAPLPPPSPVTYFCSVNPSSVFPGEPIAASGTALNLDPAKTAVYTWRVDGGTVTGVSNTAKIDTTNLAPGAYTLKCHVSEGDKANENADAAAPYIVKAFEPPSVSCAANPQNMISGETSTITATGVSPQNRPLTYSYSSTSGSVTGSGTTATLSTAGAPVGPVTVTCTVVDDKGQTASGTTMVTVSVPVSAPQPMTSSLCSIHFDRDAGRPSRVDNEGKACLDEIALKLQRNSDARLAIVGDAGSRERGGKKLATQRAMNTKAYLVKEKGIDSSRIAVYTGSLDGKTVETTLIPAGATLNATGDTLVE